MHDEDEFRLVTEVPAVDEYCALRISAGLSPRNVAAATRGLPNSLFAAVIRKDGELVAMGRIVGDDGCNFEIVDIAVAPEVQRRGLGTRIMAALMEYLQKNAPATAYVSLIADNDSPALYRKFGFRPTTPKSIGMAQRME